MVDRTTPEHDFARFKEAGDLRALERLFNRLAPQLLLVAAHVTRDAALAEDLVQTTFLEAIRSAARWTPGRPVLPWLSGILVHHARKAYRRASRRLEPERLPKRAAAPPPPDAAAAQELAAAVSSALAELPRPYGQVLLLRLVHDLQPAQIAHTLGCPPNTVKTRLRRGLELLRQRLPPGLALPAALVLAQGRGLAAVRGEVLRAADTHATVLCCVLPPVPLALLAGVLVMKKTTVTVVIAVVALLLGTLATLGTDLAAFLGGATAAEPDLTAERPPEAVAAPAAPQPGVRAALAQPRPDGVAFAGRCVDAEDGTALAGCRVSVALCADRDQMEGRLAGAQTTDLAAAVTTGDGRFELSAEHHAESPYLLAIDHTDRLGRRRLFREVGHGQRFDFGDIRLHAGTRVSGIVLDQRRQTIPHGRFRLLRDEQVRFDPVPEWSYVDVAVDGAGQFAIERPLAPGSWSILWSGTDDHLGTQVTIEARAAQHLEIVLPVEDERQTIHGGVVDAAGKPVDWLAIAATGGGTYGRAQTAHDGTFAIFRRGPYDALARGPVAVTIEDPIGRWELTAPLAVEWGSRGLRVVVRPAAEAIVRPVDARTAGVVRDYELQVAAVVVTDGQESLQPYKTESARLPDGAMRLRALRRGANVVRVEPRDPGLAASGLVRFEASTAGAKPVVIELVPPVELRVQVVDAGGMPVAGSRLQLFRTLATGEVPSLATIERSARLQSGTRWYNGGTELQPLEATRTAEDGTACLQAASGAEHWLVLLGPGHVPEVMGPFTGRAGMAAIRVVVARGATLRGRIGPPELLTLLGGSPEIEALRPLMDARVRAEVELRATKIVVDRVAAEQDPRRWQPRVEVPLRADGTFEHRGLPAGTYDVALAAVLPHGLDDGQMIDVALDRLELRDGESTELRRDLPQLMPGRLRGRVLVNGEPFARMAVSLHGTTATKKESGFHHLKVDADGRFDAQLMPGAYRLWIPCRTHGTANVGYWRSSEAATVVAGQTADHTFSMRRVAARVRILTADGAPAPGLRVTMNCSSQPQGWTSWTTDGDGWIEIVPAPLEPFALLVAHPNAATGLAAKLPGTAKDAWLGAFRVPDTGNEARFEERLPEGWR